jgi:hypothetical protein
MFAAVTFAALLAAAPAPNAVMQWSMQANSNGTVGFETRYRAVTSGGTASNDDSRDYPLSGLETTFRGLTHAQLFGPGGAVQFTISRQEGTLACAGHARGGVASGDFTIALDPGFASELQRRGVGGVSQERQMEWLLSDVDVYGLLDELKNEGFPAPSVDLLSRAIDHGVTVQYARALAAAGMHALAVEQLIRAVDHGVTARYVAAAGAYGFRGLTLDQAIVLVDHGVTANYLAGLAKLGYRVTPDQAVQLVDHGVTIRYIERLRDSGYANLTVADLVRLADHGVH